MKRILGLVYLVFTASLANASVVIADWTFEGPNTTSFGNNYTYGAADIGTVASSASEHHASASTTWSFSVGNGSLQGLDSTRWAVNDYYQFTVSTAGYNSISISFDQMGSSTGPGKFIFEYSTDGSTFSSFGGDYTVKSPGWNSSSSTTLSTFTENLTSISGLNNNSAVVFRLVDDSTISEGNGGVTTVGTSRLDNFIVNGISVVPEPAEWGLISAVGLLGICGLREWRQRGRKVPPLI